MSLFVFYTDTLIVIKKKFKDQNEMPPFKKVFKRCKVNKEIYITSFIFKCLKII